MATGVDRRGSVQVELVSAIAGIYVTQSLVTGIAVLSMPALMRAAGASLQGTGLVALFMLPWGLKFLWAPWVERWRIPPAPAARRSRGLILAGQGLLAIWLLLAGLHGMGGMDGMVGLAAGGQLAGSVPALLSVLWVAAALAATIDVACDGFAVDQLSAGERGWGNMAQVGGSYVGIALGGSGFLLLAGFAGWPWALAAAAVLVGLMTLPLALWPRLSGLRPWVRPGVVAVSADPAHDAVVTVAADATWGQQQGDAPRPSLTVALANPAVRRGLLLTVVCAIGVRLAVGLLTPLLVDRGASLTLIGLLNGLLGIGCGLLGSVLGGVLVRRQGAAAAVRRVVIVQTLVMLALALTAWQHAPLAALAGLLGLQIAVMAAGFVAIYSLLMGWASPQQAGVDFTLFQCADALVASLAGVAGAVFAQHWGYPACFALAALCLLIAALALPSLLALPQPASRQAGASHLVREPF